MKPVKLIGVVLLVVLSLLVLAAALIAWRFDEAWAKDKLVQAVQQKTQRTLTIDGDLSLAFFPSLGIELNKASLSERNAPQEFASIERARVSVRLWPLLSRQVAVDRLELDGVRARIVRDAGGSFNFDDLLTSQPQPAAAASADTAGEAPVEVDIAGLRITRSSASFQDRQSGQSLQLSEVEVRTDRLGQAGSGALRVGFKARGEQPRLDAGVQLDGRYRYELPKQQFALDQLALTLRGDVLDFSQLDASLKAAHVAYGGAQGSVEARDLVLALKGRQGQDAIEARASLPQLAWAQGRASGPQASAGLKLAGAQRQLDANLTLSALQGVAAKWSADKLAAQWTLRQGPLATSGTIAGGVQADLAQKVLALPGLAGEVQVAHPSLPMKEVKLPLQASLRADWGRSQASGQLATRLDDSALQGKFSVSRFSPLALGFDLAVDRLNVDRYLPQQAAAPAQAPFSPPPGAKAPPAGADTAAIDLSFLRGFDLAGTLRIGALQARQLKFDKVAATLAVKNGRLDADPVSAELYQGKLAAALSAQAEGNRVALRQTLDGIAVGPLLRDAAGKDVLEGRGRLVLDVRSAGGTADAMLRALDGSASLALRDGAIKGINLAKALRQARAALRGESRDAAFAADRAEKTDFSELTASFRIQDGVARNDDLDAKSPFLRVTGAGTLDLPRERIDYLAKATVVASSRGQDGRELDELRGLTIPVRLTGPFDDPSYRLELGALAGELAKQQVRKRVEEQLDKQLGGSKGLGDLLRGLRR
ncbi:AsmA family protein [Ramlibacter rhizophilus]|uniref:AsmA family protein n=1 Tax=Ramlibacter rhizophilus TaxID=1781167 RepID=A0A4Z0BJ46_9BURK|nr:AsmA family protein [Ramlibacter rhizophilus]TFY98439.1 AsmA family protein [Ramlibacter rhizophilus]